MSLPRRRGSRGSTALAAAALMILLLPSVPAQPSLLPSDFRAPDPQWILDGARPLGGEVRAARHAYTGEGLLLEGAFGPEGGFAGLALESAPGRPLVAGAHAVRFELLHDGGACPAWRPSCARTAEVALEVVDRARGETGEPRALASLRWTAVATYAAGGPRAPSGETVAAGAATASLAGVEGIRLVVEADGRLRPEALVGGNWTGGLPLLPAPASDDARLRLRVVVGASGREGQTLGLRLAGFDAPGRDAPARVVVVSDASAAPPLDRAPDPAIPLARWLPAGTHQRTFDLPGGARCDGTLRLAGDALVALNGARAGEANGTHDVGALLAGGTNVLAVEARGPVLFRLDVACAALAETPPALPDVTLRAYPPATIAPGGNATYVVDLANSGTVDGVALLEFVLPDGLSVPAGAAGGPANGTALLTVAVPAGRTSRATLLLAASPALEDGARLRPLVRLVGVEDADHVHKPSPSPAEVVAHVAEADRAWRARELAAFAALPPDRRASVLASLREQGHAHLAEEAAGALLLPPDAGAVAEAVAPPPACAEPGRTWSVRLGAYTTGDLTLRFRPPLVDPATGAPLSYANATGAALPLAPSWIALRTVDGRVADVVVHDATPRTDEDHELRRRAYAAAFEAAYPGARLHLQDPDLSGRKGIARPSADDLARAAEEAYAGSGACADAPPLDAVPTSLEILADAALDSLEPGKPYPHGPVGDGWVLGWGRASRLAAADARLPAFTLPAEVRNASAAGVAQHVAAVVEHEARAFATPGATPFEGPCCIRVGLGATPVPARPGATVDLVIPALDAANATVRASDSLAVLEVLRLDGRVHVRVRVGVDAPEGLASVFAGVGEGRVRIDRERPTIALAYLGETNGTGHFQVAVGEDARVALLVSADGVSWRPVPVAGPNVSVPLGNWSFHTTAVAADAAGRRSVPPETAHARLYEVRVVSRFENAFGSGWYAHGARFSLGVHDAELPTGTFLDALGSDVEFRGWRRIVGVPPSERGRTEVRSLEGPLGVEADYRADHSIPLGVGSLVVVGGLYGAWAFARRR